MVTPRSRPSRGAARANQRELQGLRRSRAAAGSARGYQPYRISLTGTDIDQLVNDIATLDQNVSRSSIRRGVASQLSRNLKAISPFRTGALRQSMSVASRATGIFITMLFYGRFLDEGTSSIAPRMFVQRAIETTINNAQRILNLNLRRG